MKMTEPQRKEYVDQLRRFRQPAKGVIRADLTDQQRKEQQEYIKANNLPF